MIKNHTDQKHIRRDLKFLNCLRICYISDQQRLAYKRNGRSFVHSRLGPNPIENSHKLKQ